MEDRRRSSPFSEGRKDLVRTRTDERDGAQVRSVLSALRLARLQARETKRAQGLGG